MKLGELKDAFASMLHGHYTEMTILSKAEEQVSLDTNKNMTYLYTTKVSFRIEYFLTQLSKIGRRI